MSSPAHLATDRPATYTIGARALRTALAAVMKHASKDTARPHLNGILLHADDGIVAVATDGHRLACYTAGRTVGADHGPADAGTVLLKLADAKSLEKALRPLCPKNRPSPLVTIAWPLERGLRVSFSWDGGALVYRSADEAFPPYDKVIPRAGEAHSISNVVALDPKYAAEAFQAFTAAGMPAVQVWSVERTPEPPGRAASGRFYGGPVLMTGCDVDLCAELRVVVMPRAIDDTGDRFVLASKGPALDAVAA